jgi:putative DNA primase/helicase
LAVRGIALDLDDGSLTLAEAMAILPFACVGYSSPSHTPEKPKSRILVPFTEAIPPEDFEAIFEWAQDQLGGVLDPSTRNSDRAYYTRAHLQGVEPLLEVQEGPWLEPGEIIKEAREATPEHPERPQRTPQPKGSRQESLEDIAEMLGAIPSEDRDVWLRVCHGLKSWAWEAEVDDGAAFGVFDVWAASTTADNYDPEANIKLWEDSDPERDGGVTLGSLVEMAREGGWRGRLGGSQIDPSSHDMVIVAQPGDLTLVAQEQSNLQPLDDAELPLSDTTNALWFAKQYRDQARYCHQHRCWYLWRGQRWERDESEQVYELAMKSVWSFKEEAWDELPGDRLQELARFVKQSLDHKRLTSCLKLAQFRCAVRPKDFDTDPWLLNCENGTIDLRINALRPHDPNDLITKIVPVSYDPLAECPRWLEFLTQITGGDQELISYLQRVVGYCLSGDTSEHCLFILHGMGANGKSTFLNIIKAMLGSYAMQVQADSLMVRRSEGARTDIARLAGARFVTASESEANQKLAEGLVKQLTGGDTVTARFLYQEEFEFEPEFKLFLGTNRKPDISGTDEGIWRRIHLVPFEVTIPEEERDKKLPEKLKAELEGILAWAVEGSSAWQREGLQPPEKVQTAVQQYRTETDTVGQFLDDCCKRNPESKVSTKDLYDAYRGWCYSNGETALAKHELGKQLKERGFTTTRTKSIRGWGGLELIETPDPVLEF